MKGVVVETFGSGNVPSNRPDLMEAFQVANDRGVIVVNITQCLKGSVRDAYAAGRVSRNADSHTIKAPCSPPSLLIRSKQTLR